MDLWLSSKCITAVVSPDADLSGIPAALCHVRRREGLWDMGGEGEA